MNLPRSISRWIWFQAKCLRERPIQLQIYSETFRNWNHIKFAQHAIEQNVCLQKIDVFIKSLVLIILDVRHDMLSRETPCFSPSELDMFIRFISFNEAIFACRGVVILWVPIKVSKFSSHFQVIFENTYDRQAICYAERLCLLMKPFSFMRRPNSWSYYGA